MSYEFHHNYSQEFKLTNCNLFSSGYYMVNKYITGMQFNTET